MQKPRASNFKSIIVEANTASIVDKKSFLDVMTKLLELDVRKITENFF